MMKGLSCEERLSQLRPFCQEKTRLKEGILPMCTNQEWEGRKGGEAVVFPVVPIGRTRDSGINENI